MLNGTISKNKLHKANNREHERLIERFNSSDFHTAINNIFKQKMLKTKL